MGAASMPRPRGLGRSLCLFGLCLFQRKRGGIGKGGRLSHGLAPALAIHHEVSTPTPGIQPPQMVLNFTRGMPRRAGLGRAVGNNLAHGHRAIGQARDQNQVPKIGPQRAGVPWGCQTRYQFKRGVQVELGAPHVRPMMGATFGRALLALVAGHRYCRGGSGSHFSTYVVGSGGMPDHDRNMAYPSTERNSLKRISGMHFQYMVNGPLVCKIGIADVRCVSQSGTSFADRFSRATESLICETTDSAMR